MNIRLVILSVFLICSFLRGIAQCDEIPSWKDSIVDWKLKYFTYFGVDPKTVIIKSDSVLISYLSHPENSTNRGMSCSYYQARDFAEIEMENSLMKLFTNLGIKDSANFSESQELWSQHYNKECQFIGFAFQGYANYSKYGLGREIMIDNASVIYQMLKVRILEIINYIELSEYYEETNDD